MGVARLHDYRKERLGQDREIRRFEATAPGRYAVEAVGPGPDAGDRVCFTLKGSESLELVLEVATVRHQIIPTQGWVAELVGPDFDALDIHRWTIACDSCGHRARLEFAAPTGAAPADVEAAATARAERGGWQLADGEHLCPKCV